MQHFTIPFPLPGMNRIIQESKVHWAKYAEMKAEYDGKIGLYIVAANLEPMESVWLRFTWQEETRRRDKDNIAAAKKFILDALQKQKIFVNDGWNQIQGWEDRFTVGEPQVTVELYPEPPNYE